MIMSEGIMAAKDHIAPSATRLVIQPKPTPSTDILTELQRISTNSLLVFNRRDFEHRSPIGQEVLRHISSDYTAQLDYIPEVLLWPQLVDVSRKWALEDSRLAFNACHASAHMYEEGFASVLIDLEVIGLSNVELKAITELRWRREENGEWMIFHFWSSRGMPGNDGFL